MTTQEIQNDVFKNARAKFLNGMIDTSPTKAGEARNTPDEQVKQPVKRHPKVKQQSTIHLAWKSPTGAGLNELNAKKKDNSATTKLKRPHANVMKDAHELNPFRELRERNGSDSSSSSKTSSIDFEALASSAQADLDPVTIDDMLFGGINDPTPCLPQRSEAPKVKKNPNIQSKSSPVTIDDVLFGGINDPTSCLEPQKSEAPKVKKQVRFQLPEEAEKSPTSTSPLDHNPIYQGKKLVDRKRFEPKHPSQKINQPDFTKPAEIYSNLVRCSNTHSGETFEPQMERKSDNNVSPRKKAAETPMHFPIRGNDKKGITEPDASYNKKPQFKVSGVNVSEIVNIFNGKNR